MENVSFNEEIVQGRRTASFARRRQTQDLADTTTAMLGNSENKVFVTEKFDDILAEGRGTYEVEKAALGSLGPQTNTQKDDRLGAGFLRPVALSFGSFRAPNCSESRLNGNNGSFTNTDDHHRRANLINRGTGGHSKRASSPLPPGGAEEQSHALEVARRLTDDSHIGVVGSLASASPNQLNEMHLAAGPPLAEAQPVQAEDGAVEGHAVPANGVAPPGPRRFIDGEETVPDSVTRLVTSVIDSSVRSRVPSLFQPTSNQTLRDLRQIARDLLHDENGLLRTVDCGGGGLCGLRCVAEGLGDRASEFVGKYVASCVNDFPAHELADLLREERSFNGNPEEPREMVLFTTLDHNVMRQAGAHVFGRAEKIGSSLSALGVDLLVLHSLGPGADFFSTALNQDDVRNCPCLVLYYDDNLAHFTLLRSEHANTRLRNQVFDHTRISPARVGRPSWVNSGPVPRPKLQTFLMVQAVWLVAFYRLPKFWRVILLSKAGLAAYLQLCLFRISRAVADPEEIISHYSLAPSGLMSSLWQTDLGTRIRALNPFHSHGMLSIENVVQHTFSRHERPHPGIEYNSAAAASSITEITLHFVAEEADFEFEFTKQFCTLTLHKFLAARAGRRAMHLLQSQVNEFNETTVTSGEVASVSRPGNTNSPEQLGLNGPWMVYLEEIFQLSRYTSLVAHPDGAAAGGPPVPPGGANLPNEPPVGGNGLALSLRSGIPPVALPNRVAIATNADVTDGTYFKHSTLEAALDNMRFRPGNVVLDRERDVLFDPNQLNRAPERFKVLRIPPKKAIAAAILGLPLHMSGGRAFALCSSQRPLNDLMTSLQALSGRNLATPRCKPREVRKFVKFMHKSIDKKLRDPELLEELVRAGPEPHPEEAYRDAYRGKISSAEIERDLENFRKLVDGELFGKALLDMVEKRFFTKDEHSDKEGLTRTRLIAQMSKEEKIRLCAIIRLYSAYNRTVGRAYQVKNVTPDEFTDRVTQVTSTPHMVTDYSKFECSIMSVYRESCERRLAHGLCRAAGWFNLDQNLHRIMGPVNKLKFTGASADIHTRNSGNFETSVGNGLANHLLICYCWSLTDAGKRGEPPPDHLTEGDDGIIPQGFMENFIPLLADLGFEFSSAVIGFRPGDADFLSRAYLASRCFGDIYKVCIKLLWSSAPLEMKKSHHLFLLRCKAYSAWMQFGQTPIITALVVQIGFLTRSCTRFRGYHKHLDAWKDHFGPISDYPRVVDVPHESRQIIADGVMGFPPISIPVQLEIERRIGLCDWSFFSFMDDHPSAAEYIRAGRHVVGWSSTLVHSRINVLDTGLKNLFTLLETVGYDTENTFEQSSYVGIGPHDVNQRVHASLQT